MKLNATFMQLESEMKENKIRLFLSKIQRPFVF